MSKKRIIVVLAIICILISIIAIALNPKQTSKPKIINNKTNKTEVTKDTKIKGLDLTDIAITFSKETGSTYSAKIINNTSETVNIDSFDVIFKDKDDNVLTSITLFVGGDMVPKQENIIKSTFLEDVTSATKVEYKIN